MTRDDLDAAVWRLITGLYAGDLRPPAVHAAVMDAADEYAAGASRRASLETALTMPDRKRKDRM